MRRHDWPERLVDYFQERKDVPFSWGVNDCCMFAFGAVVAQGLPSPKPVEAEKYRTIKGSIGVIAKLAPGGTLEDAVVVALSKRSGFEEIPVLMAQRGDILLLDLKDFEMHNVALGVVDLDGRYGLFVSKSGGLIRTPVKDCRRAWRVE